MLIIIILRINLFKCCPNSVVAAGGAGGGDAVGGTGEKGAVVGGGYCGVVDGAAGFDLDRRSRGAPHSGDRVGEASHNYSGVDGVAAADAALYYASLSGEVVVGAAILQADEAAGAADHTINSLGFYNHIGTRRQDAV